MSIDDKLRKILREPGNALAQYEDTTIAQIKQAFKDEGWQQWIGPNSVAVVGLDDLKPPTNEYNRPSDKRFSKPIPFMTGKEWYDRFEKELDNISDMPVPPKVIRENEKAKRYYLAHWVNDEVIKAAKKASGLSNGSDGSANTKSVES